MKLWGGRFVSKSDRFFEEFNSSIKVDYRLVQQDIFGSIAWSDALYKSGILTQQENITINQALNQLSNNVQKDVNVFLNSSSEDVHSWVEEQLIQLVGDVGKKLHTGRSRNDQVTTDLKLWCKYTITELFNKILEFKKALVRTSEKTQNIIMPGYTHLQRAQPITFSFWCLAYLEMIKRDEDRLKDALERLDYSPLGCGAISGTSWNIDREELAKKMGFKSATNNSLDSVSDRDYVVELASVASIGMMHLSRFSEDLIFFNSSELNFVELSDKITSGSSLMPQKKNPDALELIRSKSGKVFGFLMNILVVLKGLPLAYNKDLQEDKEGLFNILDIWNDCLSMSTLILENMHVNYITCLEATKKGYLNATELADYLVNKGITFRDAHQITGQIVLKALKLNLSLEELDLTIFKKYSKKIEEDVYSVLNIFSLLDKRISKGGVSPQVTLATIKKEKLKLKM